MVTLESNIYNKSVEGNIILGATIILYNSENNEIEKISVVDESELNALKHKLDVLGDTYIKFNEGSSLAGRSIDSLLSNQSQDVVINASRLNGLASSDFSQIGHTHDDRYYTESEIDTKLIGKASASHSHRSFSKISSNDNYVAYAKDVGVRVVVSMRSNSSEGHTYSVGTLPSGYRPPSKVAAPTTSIASSGDNFGWITVDTNGAIKLILAKSTSGGRDLYGSVYFLRG